MCTLLNKRPIYIICWHSSIGNEFKRVKPDSSSTRPQTILKVEGSFGGKLTQLEIS